MSVVVSLVHSLRLLVRSRAVLHLEITVAERVRGTRHRAQIRRECLDHVIVMNAAGLHRVLHAQNLFVPLKPLSRMPPDHPEVPQRQRNTRCFRRSAAFDQPRHRGAVVIKIVPHSIEPLALRGSDQPVGRESSLARAIARQPVQRLVTLPTWPAVAPIRRLKPRLWRSDACSPRFARHLFLRVHDGDNKTWTHICGMALFSCQERPAILDFEFGTSDR